MPAPAIRTGPLADETTATRERIDSLLTPVRVQAGRTLIHEGSIGREFFVIAEGRAEVRRGDGVISELGPGDYFGELALMGATRRNASVTALTDMHVLVANPREFRALLDVSSRLVKSIEQTTGARTPALAS